ncbi:MAG: hypothetical protein ACYC27_07885 [Armatimonadota bacterium]
MKLDASEAESAERSDDEAATEAQASVKLIYSKHTGPTSAATSFPAVGLCDRSNRLGDSISCKRMQGPVL